MHTTNHLTNLMIGQWLYNLTKAWDVGRLDLLRSELVLAIEEGVATEEQTLEAPGDYDEGRLWCMPDSLVYSRTGADGLLWMPGMAILDVPAFLQGGQRKATLVTLQGGAYVALRYSALWSLSEKHAAFNRLLGEWMQQALELEKRRMQRRRLALDGDLDTLLWENER
jgi:hypothetical protein